MVRPYKSPKGQSKTVIIFRNLIYDKTNNIKNNLNLIFPTFEA
jgi:hypothetical protein